jgi:hypothetical protein
VDEERVQSGEIDIRAVGKASDLDTFCLERVKQDG